LVWISIVGCIGGIIFQVFRFLAFTRINKHVPFNPRPRKKDEKKIQLNERTILGAMTKVKLSVIGVNPLMITVTTVFHLCLIVIPLFLLAHNILLKNTIGFAFFSFSEKTSDVLTLILLACGLYFLYRRLFVPKVKAITDGYDYLFLFLATAPFITGFLAYHQIMHEHYKLIIALHILFGEIMLLAIPFTKFVHMLFYFVFRFVVEGEWSLGSGNRTW
jgi:nitrate reductase gamma subunit